MSAAGDRRDRLQAMLADFRLPGALEAVDGILAQADNGAVTASEAMEELLNAQIVLRNNRRLQTAMRASRLPAVKTLGQRQPFLSRPKVPMVAVQTLAQFDFAFQPSIKREQIESLHELDFLERRENVVFLGPKAMAEVPTSKLRQSRGPSREDMVATLAATADARGRSSVADHCPVRVPRPASHWRSVAGRRHRRPAEPASWHRTEHGVQRHEGRCRPHRPGR